MFPRKPRRKADTPLKAPLAYGRGSLKSRKHQAIPEHEPLSNTVEQSDYARVSTLIIFLYYIRGHFVTWPFASKNVKHMESILNPYRGTCVQKTFLLVGGCHVVFLSLQISSRHVQFKSKFQPRSTNGIWPLSSPPSAAAAAAAGEAERVGRDISGHPMGQARPSPLQTGMTPVENSSDSSDHDDMWDFSSSSSDPSPEIFRDDSDTSTFDFSGEADPLDTQRHMQRPCSSTLLSSSHAENIARHQPPNVSAILDKPSEGTSLKSAVAKRPISYRKAQPFKTPLVPSRPREKPNFSPPMVFQYSDREEFFRQVRERADRLKSFRLSLRPSVP
ncbi:uncharacterized protein LOC133168224 isoform X1 [Syngnathus typhle]|uniref:uncharacterized protein LOC133168224 isoform X1 n=1 Tax=Syngnathus typhle TaxID=161592 RepID=UPI002A6A66BB|nr:uncharacterized protein LOC133168224 isoform X1 [Syngnathus typhle]